MSEIRESEEIIEELSKLRRKFRRFQKIREEAVRLYPDPDRLEGRWLVSLRGLGEQIRKVAERLEEVEREFKEAIKQFKRKEKGNG